MIKTENTTYNNISDKIKSKVLYNTIEMSSLNSVIKKKYKKYLKKGNTIKKLSKKGIKELFIEFHGNDYRYDNKSSIINLYNILTKKITVINQRKIAKYIGFKNVQQLKKKQLNEILGYSVYIA